MAPHRIQNFNHDSRLKFNLDTNVSDQGLDVDQRLVQLEEQIKSIFTIIAGRSHSTEPQLKPSVLTMTSATREAYEETYLPRVAIDKQRSSLSLAYDQYQNNQKSLNQDCDEAITTRYNEVRHRIGFAAHLIKEGQGGFETAGVLERFKNQTKQVLTYTWRLAADLKYDMQAATITSALRQIAELKEEIKKAGEKAA